MKLISSLLIVAALVVVAYSFPTERFGLLDLSGNDQPVKFTVALRNRNLDVLDRMYADLTNPLSPNYQQWKTIDELNAIVAPAKADSDRVLAWLESHNISYELFGDHVACVGKANDVSALLGVQFYGFRHLKTGIIIHRSLDNIQIPDELKDVVYFVTGVSDFPHEGKSFNGRTADATTTYVVPQTVRNLYNMNSNTAASQNTQTSQAVAEFSLSAGISDSDLKTFMQLTDGNTNAALNYTVGNYVGFNPNNGVDGESTLDVQYIMSIAPNVPTSFWVVDGWIYDFTALVEQRQAKNQAVPDIFSLSYGWAESDQCEITGMGTSCRQLGGTSEDYVTATNTQLQKVTMTGVTIVVSSGDAGAAAKINIDCSDNKSPVNPNYPASSPYVLTVGGTMLQNGGTALTGNLPPFCTEKGVSCAGGGVEVVATVPQALITSGGGFSNYVARNPSASYQNTAVSSYLSSGALLPPTKYFNSNGRAYPDVAAIAHALMIVYGGDSVSVDGTSASAPITAAILSLINDQRLANGKTTLGAINTAVYGAAQSNFNDITIGNNTGTEDNGLFGAQYCFTYGYGAVAGWDACTGFGTPNYVNWQNVFG